MFLWQELLRYSFGSYYETLSSKIMEVTSFFVSDIGEIANKMLLAVFKRCGKNRRGFRKKPEEDLYLRCWKAGPVKRRKDICLLKNVLKHCFQEVFMNSFLDSKGTRYLVKNEMGVREKEELKLTNL